jgi:hypothetical protein
VAQFPRISALPRILDDPKNPIIDPATDSAIDSIFFVFGGLASIWLVWELIRESFGLGWWQILFWVGFWVVLAYLLLPRLHRILTRIYVPGYFIGRARTSDGLLGDPVNLALLGSEAQLHVAMDSAAWTRADDLSLRTGLRIVRSTLLRASYLEAPVSPLLLFGRKQDFAYQQEVNGTPGKRHHVRFWRCPENWLLPGGSRAEWLAAGTYDRSVGFSLFTLQITHKIAPDTDVERDHVITTLKAAETVHVHTIQGFSAGYHSRNGGGDTIETDGNLPVVDLRGVDAPVGSDEVVTDSRDRRPSPTIVGSLLVALSGLAAIASGIEGVFGPTSADGSVAAEIREAVGILLIVFSVLVTLFGIASLLIAWGVFLGRNVPRVLAMSFAVVVIALEIISGFGGDRASITANLPTICLNVLVLFSLSSERALIYARRKRKVPKRISGLPGNVGTF